MKKLATVLCLSALASAVFAQGTINSGNTGLTLASTNAVAAGGTAGVTATTLGGFQYAVFTAASTVTSAQPLDILGSSWTFTGLYMTNTAATTGGRFNGGSGVAVPTGWPAGQTNSFLVAGWSTSFGANWAEVSAQLTGATLSGGQWTGPNITKGGFFGESVVSFGAAGGGASGLPAFSLFNPTPTAQGTPISTGFNLYVVAVPEPATIALAGLGAAAMLIFRRRK